MRAVLGRATIRSQLPPADGSAVSLAAMCYGVCIGGRPRRCGLQAVPQQSTLSGRRAARYRRRHTPRRDRHPDLLRQWPAARRRAVAGSVRRRHRGGAGAGAVRRRLIKTHCTGPRGRRPGCLVLPLSAPVTVPLDLPASLESCCWQYRRSHSGWRWRRPGRSLVDRLS
jgi:hypothetical protein